MPALKPGKHVTVINRGNLGQRFVELCRLHNHEVDEVVLEFGKQVTHSDLNSIASVETAAPLINMHETSSGALQEMKFVSDFCRARGLIIDTASTFVADEIGMAALGADVILAGSQKALACNSGGSQSVLEQHVLLRTDRPSFRFPSPRDWLQAPPRVFQDHRRKAPLRRLHQGRLRMRGRSRLDQGRKGSGVRGRTRNHRCRKICLRARPWWKTDYFEVRFEDSSLNKRYFYQLDGEGIRYKLVSFLRTAKRGGKCPYMPPRISLAIADVAACLYDRDGEC